MLKFLAFVFLLVLGLILFLGVFLGGVIRSFGSAKTRNSNNRPGSNNYQDAPQKKFTKEEGEYVNYEEVKDEE